MSVDFLWLVATTAILFTSAQVLQSSRTRVTTVAAYAIIGIFAARRLFELVIFWLGKAATGVAHPLPWGHLLTWSTLGSVVAQYVVAVIVLALLYRYDQTTAAWVIILAIGGIGLAALLV